MSYEGFIKQLLDKAGAEEGDLIELSVRDKSYKGILMPHHEFSSKEIITIKLANGYNIGVELSEDSKVKVLERGEEKRVAQKEIPFDAKKRTVAILGTGGTIASYVDYRTGAVHPALSAEDLAFSVPELLELCNVKAKVLFSMLSENMKVKHWQRLAGEVAEQLNAEVKGVVISHGTDTMHYTASALSFMLQNLNAPVIFVGSQRSSDRPSSDATLNLIASVNLAINSELGEVVVVMHGETSDSYCLIHRGVKVRKMHTSRRDAFQSINAMPLGKVDGEKIEFFQEYKRRCEGKVELREGMEEKVSLIYFHPNFKREWFEFIAERCKGIVIAGTGLGHVSSEILDCVKDAVDKGVHVVMTSQCIYGSVNMNVYSTGRDLIRAGVIPGEDMLPETAYVKLMWVLGQTKDNDEVKRLMQRNIVGEMSSGRRIDEF